MYKIILYPQRVLLLPGFCLTRELWKNNWKWNAYNLRRLQTKFKLIFRSIVMTVLYEQHIVEKETEQQTDFGQCLTSFRQPDGARWWTESGGPWSRSFSMLTGRCGVYMVFAFQSLLYKTWNLDLQRTFLLDKTDILLCCFANV